jgi:exodeoxyribonuclease VII small subunit
VGADGTAPGSPGDKTDPGSLGYEAARDELAEVVRRLEAGGLALEESLALWERGEQLAGVCEQHLAGARERIEAAIASSESGDPHG